MYLRELWVPTQVLTQLILRFENLKQMKGAIDSEMWQLTEGGTIKI